MQARQFAFAVILLLAGNVGEAGADRGPDSREVVVFSSGAIDELYASTSPEDWSTNADRIVDATMTAERDAPDGDGSSRVGGRIGTFQVNDDLLHRADAPTLSAQFDLPILGWVDEAGERRDVAMAGLPRLEVGHRYVLALMHDASRCDADDGVDPGGWALIGSSGVLPYDDGILGFGEVEGTPGSELVAGPGSLLAAMGEGAPAADLASVVEHAPWLPRGPRPGDLGGC